MAYQGLVNLTPFAAGEYLLADEAGRDVMTVVVKATYEIKTATSLSIADEQEEILVAPQYYGEPGESSLRIESETPFTKPATDVALLGHAYSTRADRTQVDVRLRVGRLEKTVRVFGDRYWRRTLGLRSMSSPEPFEKIALVYEYAFGGRYEVGDSPSRHGFDTRNPVGKGFVPRKNAGIPPEHPLPNLEDPRQLISGVRDRPMPAGFGFILPGWEPRSRLAGSYDQHWERTRMPLLPLDFDRRYFNAGSPGLIAAGFLAGGEPVEVLNASEKGPLRFELPRARPEAVLRFRDGPREAKEAKLDTVVIDTDEHQVSLIWRATFAVFKRIYDVAWVKIQLLEPEAL